MNLELQNVAKLWHGTSVQTHDEKSYVSLARFSPHEFNPLDRIIIIIIIPRDGNEGSILRLKRSGT